MSLISSTETYLFQTKVILKNNSNFTLFLGKKKTNGSYAVVKQYLPGYSDKFWKIQQEIDLLKSLKHNNIVRLICSESETTNPDNELLILEYCNEGTLRSKLQQPENKYGLLDCEYLNLLHCLKNGVDYLQNQGICHRDIQPDNIMIQRSISGELIYKIDNFSSAKRLSANETFTSIAGTEEYMSPLMYKTAVNNEVTNQSFTSLVDLWSLGVTLYESATGRLPFVPLNYRRCSESRRTLCKMYSDKAKSVISAIERENRKIEWNQAMPEKCALSCDLKSLLTPILQKLFETHSNRMCTFENFFREVQTLLNHKVVRIFYPRNGDLRITYLSLKDDICSQDTLNKLTGKIHELWNANNVILFQHGQILSPSTQKLETGHSSRPVICGFKMPIIDPANIPPRCRVTCAHLDIPTIRNCDDLSNFIHEISAEIHYLATKADILRESASLCEDFFQVFHAHIQEGLVLIQTKMPTFMGFLQASIDIGHKIIDLQNKCDDSKQSYQSMYGTDGFEKDLNQLSDSGKEAEKLRSQYNQKVIQNCELRKRWNPPSMPQNANFSRDHYISELSKITDILQNMKDVDDELGRQDLQLEGRHGHSVYQLAVENLQNLEKFVNNLHAYVNKWLHTAGSVIHKIETFANFNDKLEKTRESAHTRSMNILNDMLQSSLFSSDQASHQQ